jgi:protein phosphatase
VEPELICEPLKGGDTLLLCSDGLSDLVDDWQLLDTLNACKGDLENTCRKLVDHANRNGGSDNVTVLLARYEA